jgi:hypothetical protein
VAKTLIRCWRQLRADPRSCMEANWLRSRSARRRRPQPQPRPRPGRWQQRCRRTCRTSRKQQQQQGVTRLAAGMAGGSGTAAPSAATPQTSRAGPAPARSPRPCQSPRTGRLAVGTHLRPARLPGHVWLCLPPDTGSPAPRPSGSSACMAAPPPNAGVGPGQEGRSRSYSNGQEIFQSMKALAEQMDKVVPKVSARPPRSCSGCAGAGGSDACGQAARRPQPGISPLTAAGGCRRWAAQRGGAARRRRPRSGDVDARSRRKL